MSVIRTYASESVTEGHPDKACDQVSDAVLDAVYRANEGEARKHARVACETALKSNVVTLLGEITCENHPNYQETAREALREIGYENASSGVSADDFLFVNLLGEQSPDIAKGTNEEAQGAGDQGMMFGYASAETEVMMPLPIHLSHELTRRLSTLRKDGTLPHLRPDGKAQVTVLYEDMQPKQVTRAVVATQHTEDTTDQIEGEVIEHVIKPVLGDWFTDETVTIVNGTGEFTIGGPLGDAGLTGRKIIVDTYGGIGRHGGGAFSGKDPTKVDRSAAYCARYVAKNVVAAGLARVCEFHLAYAIGVAEPQAVGLDLFETSEVDEVKLVEAIKEVFDLTPAGIINALDLRRPIYHPTAAYGHFGRTDLDLPWERTDKVDDLKRAMGA